MFKITREADVYHCLSFHVWKSGREIRNELAEKLGVDPLGFRAPSYGTIYAYLYRLEDQKFAEQRYREISEEQLSERGGYKCVEWHLTSTGIQNKRRYETKTNDGLEGNLVPA